MAELKNMTVVTSGKLRKTAYDLLDANTNLLAWKEGGRTPADIFDGWLAQADALYSIGNIKINGALLDKAPNLKVIAQASVGYDNIDVAECNARGIRVGNTPRVLSPAVADLAYGLIIDSARKIARGWQHVASGKWGERKGLGFGVDLAGKTLGIVGMGDIGSRVVKRALASDMRVIYHNRLASDMRVIYHNRRRRSDDEALGAAYVSFEELLQTSDFVLVTVPLTKETEGMFAKKQFEAMKQGARFINIARGKIVDTEALYDALSSGHIAYAALDVTDPEPLPGTHKLLTLDNITVTPHIASSTVETRDAMAKLAAENILAGLNGEPMPAEVKA